MPTTTYLVKRRRRRSCSVPWPGIRSSPLRNATVDTIIFLFRLPSNIQSFPIKVWSVFRTLPAGGAETVGLVKVYFSFEVRQSLRYIGSIPIQHRPSVLQFKTLEKKTTY